MDVGLDITIGRICIWFCAIYEQISFIIQTTGDFRLLFVHGAVQVERAYLQALRVGSGRRDSPLIGFSADALAASNRRTVGQVSRGLERPLLDGCRESRSLPRVVNRRNGWMAE